MAGPNLEESALTITGPQCRAARALVQWPRDHVARLSGLTEKAVEDFEKGLGRLDAAAMEKLVRALEEGGAVFIPENGGGCGVRLKYASRDVRAINKWEGEGGPPGTDDV